MTLGDKLNLARCASAGTAYISMRDCSSVLAVVDTPSAGTITFKEAQSGTGTNNQVLGTASATVVPLPAPSFGAAPVYYSQTAGVWTTVPIVAGGNYVLSTGVLTLTGTPDMVVVWINQGCLSDGFNYVLATHSAKAITYILSPVDVARKAANLRNPYA